MDKNPVDRSDVGRELMPGVRLVDVAVEGIEPKKAGRFQSPASERIMLHYDVNGWTVRLRTGNYWASAEIIDLQLHGDGPGGVTTEVLRGIPLHDARARIREIQRRWAETVEPSGEEKPRLTTPHDWASFARAYADLVEHGEQAPVTLLARRLGISRNTIGARVRMAREKGLLTRPAKGSLGRLTSRAKRILEAG